MCCFFLQYVSISVFFSLAVRVAIEEMGYVKTRDDDETANLIWSDCAVQQEKIAELRNYQVRIKKAVGVLGYEEKLD